MTMDDLEAPPPPPPPPPDAADGISAGCAAANDHDGNNEQLLATSLADLVPPGNEFQENRFNASPNPFSMRKMIGDSFNSTGDLLGDQEEKVDVDDGEVGGDKDDDGVIKSIPKTQMDVSTDEESQLTATAAPLPLAAADEDGNVEGSIPSAAVGFGETNKVSITSKEEDVAKQKDTARRYFTAAVICDSIKYLYSLVLLAFSATVVMAALFTGQTNAAEMNIPPVAAFVIFWFLIVWLGMIEGGQGCLVGLQPVGKDMYSETHPVACKCTTLAHRGDNMERFIVGRQFLVVLIVFVTNMCGAATSDAAVLGLPTVINDIFLSSGFALILTTVILGQLTAQINAAKCMLDFINTYFMLFSTYVSLGIEFSGLLHSVYLVQILFSKITGKPIESEEPPLNVVQSLFFWTRVLFSLVILGIAFAVTLSALFQGKTTVWAGIPPYVSVIIFFILMCFAGMMEGMQIALFAVVNIPKDELASYSIASKICQLTFTGHNLQAFLIGRQICVTVCTFVIAKISTLDVVVGQGENIFDVSDGVQEFFNTGLLGAIITTIVASLAWRIIASDLPIFFLNNPIAYVILRLCLFFEQSGICSAAWICARLQLLVFRYQPDEVYFRRRSAAAEERVKDSENVR